MFLMYFLFFNLLAGTKQQRCAFGGGWGEGGGAGQLSSTATKKRKKENKSKKKFWKNMLSWTVLKLSIICRYFEIQNFV